MLHDVVSRTLGIVFTSIARLENHGQNPPGPGKARAEQAYSSMLKKMWKDCVKVSPHKVKRAGGDQKCENVASKLKEQLRRTNKLGTSGSKKGGATRDGLPACWLTENPGLKSVVERLATYRVAVQDKIPPGEASSDLERDVLLAKKVVLAFVKAPVRTACC